MPLESELQHRLGASLCRFETKTVGGAGRRYRKRLFEVSCVGGAALVPVGLAVVEGSLGVAMAAIGGLTALATYWLYWLTSRKTRARGLVVEVFDRGLVCSQGKESREVLWNEVVDILCRPMTASTGSTKLALALEVAGAAPLVFVCDGSPSDAAQVQGLVKVLGNKWLEIWSRRARVLMEREAVRVGPALVGYEGVGIRGRLIGWSEIRSEIGNENHTDASRSKLAALLIEPTDALELTSAAGQAQPFPSAADRIEALAVDPPRPSALPPVPSVSHKLPSEDRS